MYSKPLPRIITGAVVVMIAVAAVLTFTRGETPATDTASATLPGVSDKAGPVVVGSESTPTPSTAASADAAERQANEVDPETGEPVSTGGGSVPAKTPTTTAPDRDPTEPPPSPTPTPKPPCGVVGAILGGCK